MTDLIRSSDAGTAEPVTRSPKTATPGRGRRLKTQVSVPKRIWVLVCLVTLGGLLLRLPTFRSSLFGDEISTYFIVVGHSLDRVLRLVESNQETSPPLYFIAAWATKGLLNSPGESIRLVSLISGTATIPLTFVLGLWTVGRRAAMVAMICVALSSGMILHSGEARPFMMTAFLTLLSTLALLRALDSRRLGWWVAYAAFTCGAAYTHYTAVFLLVLQLAWALWTQPQARRALIAANVAAAVAYIPWLNGLREDLHAPNYISALAPLNFHTVKLFVQNEWIGPGGTAAVLLGAGLALGVVGLVLQARSTRLRLLLPSRTVLIALLALGPIVVMILYSLIRVDVLSSPFLIYSWPALAVLIGAIVTSPARPLWLAAVALTISAYAIGAYTMVGSSAQNPNANAVANYIDQVGTSGDPIVCQCFTTGPLTELDPALANAGRAQHHPILRLGAPTQADEQAALSGPNPQPCFCPPRYSPAQIASQAVALAHHGTIFFVTFRFPNGYDLVTSSASLKTESKAFFNSLPARFRVVGHRSYSGFSGNALNSVFVLRDTPPSR
jgi:hypothetical protein